MAKTFFIGWELWQKMVFILGCALFVTILAGLVKLWFVHWRVRKYATLEKLTDRVNVIREKSIIRSLSTKKSKSSRKKKSIPQQELPPPNMEEVPFGIRALESGTRVEDVWDSRPNSREASRVDLYRQSNTSTTDFAHPTSQPLSSREASGLTTNTDSSMDTTVDPVPADLASSSAEGNMAAPLARSRYPPHSFLRYEGAKGHRTTNTVRSRRTSGSDGPQPSTSASTFLSSASNPGSDSEGSNLEYQLRLERRPGRSQPSSIRSSSADSIYAMQQKRISQSAETGQILPRLRTDRLGVESSPDVTPVERPKRERRMSFEVDANGEDSDSKHFTAPPPRTAANTSESDGDRPTKDRRGRTAKRLRKRSSPASTSPATPTTPSSFSGPVRRSSDVMRQVNPGFAVLKPGSAEANPAQQPKPNDNVSERRSLSVESETTRKGRRLKKKRRSGDAEGSDQ